MIQFVRDVQMIFWIWRIFLPAWGAAENKRKECLSLAVIVQDGSKVIHSIFQTAHCMNIISK
ncbi:hypothetical protein FC95_GL000331 [Lentilactobacillus kefiri DSM 20587 = JCM 5818]|uniref:Uncharacterized protein n=1 Tax=Lentilactobacillus kefiri DSM 20587 = JCM 5818 TaxID=1423764 RepID=A0A8E1V339_LENKE|nr:hypothetical protein FC95_GL000331 [Lentilactobacillus kefiri DSM 20587 = JCM 5818]